MLGRHRLNGGLQRVTTAAAAGLLLKAQRKEVGQPGGSVSCLPPPGHRRGRVQPTQTGSKGRRSR